MLGVVIRDTFKFSSLQRVGRLRLDVKNNFQGLKEETRRYSKRAPFSDPNGQTSTVIEVELT